MRSLGLFCLIVSLFLFVPPTREHFPGSSPHDETVWFAFQGNESGAFAIEPIAHVSNGKLIPIPNGCRDKNPEYETFWKTYIAQGRTYEVLFRGGSIGRVSVPSSVGKFAPYSVEYKGSVPSRGPFEALATSASDLHDGTLSGPPPDAAEHRTAVRLAKQLFVQSGVPLKLLARLKVERLTKTTLRPSKYASLIGSFSITPEDKPELVHNLFFIATAKTGRYLAEFSRIHVSGGETDNESLAFLDQADLLGDGKDEVVAELGLYENNFYCIYKRTADNSHWEQIFEAETSGCE